MEWHAKKDLTDWSPESQPVEFWRSMRLSDVLRWEPCGYYVISDDNATLVFGPTGSPYASQGSRWFAADGALEG